MHRCFFNLKIFALILGAFSLLSCSNLLYYPDHYMYVNPDIMEFKPEDCVLKLANDSEIHGWYFTSSPNPKAVIVFFHGNGQNRTSHIVGLYWILKEGYDLFAVEYPGYGETDGNPTPKNTVESGHAALRYIQKRKPNTPIIVYGQSLGGAVAMRAVLDLKKEVPVSLVVADSTFLSYRKTGRVVLSKSWVTWLLQPLGWLLLDDQYAPGNKIKDLSPTPLLVIHDRKDPVIPIQLGEEVFKKAKEPKEFWEVTGGGHAQPFTGSSGLAQRRVFLEKLSRLGLKPKSTDH